MRFIPYECVCTPHSYNFNMHNVWWQRNILFLMRLNNSLNATVKNPAKHERHTANERLQYTNKLINNNNIKSIYRQDSEPYYYNRCRK